MGWLPPRARPKGNSNGANSVGHEGRCAFAPGRGAKPGMARRVKAGRKPVQHHSATCWPRCALLADAENGADIACSGGDNIDCASEQRTHNRHGPGVLRRNGNHARDLLTLFNIQANHAVVHHGINVLGARHCHIKDVVKKTVSFSSR